MKRRLRWFKQPWVMAAVLAPAGTELLTGNTPPFPFFFPPVPIMFMVLYGGGAILAHDLTVRWRRGWPSLLLLAIAYGIFEEGILVRSFFNPEWGDLDPGGNYARWAGVSWIEVVRLTAYHAAFAILIPVLLVRHAFPDRRDAPWVSNRGLKIVIGLMLLEVPIGWLLMSYRPSLRAYIGFAGAMLALVILARELPVPRINAGRGWSRRFVIAGYGGTALFFVLGWALPAAAAPPVVSLPLLTAFVLVAGWKICRSGLATDGLLALACGGLGFFASAGPVLELTGRRGMAIVGVVAIVLLVRLGRRVTADSGAVRRTAEVVPA